MKTKSFPCVIAGVVLSVTALAANAQPTQNSAAGTITPPAGISQIISIDAHNSVLVETQDPKEYSLVLPQHIYSGGVARIFGGVVIPTETLVIPQSAMRSNMGTPGNFGNFNGFSNGFGNNGFGNGFNSGNGFSGNGFAGNANNTPSFGGFGRFNGFQSYTPQSYAPRVPINNMNQFNQVLGYLDRPIRQAQVGASFSDTTSTANTGFGANY